MGKLKDLKGQKFGRLTVIDRCGTTKGRNAIWLCECECGNYIKINGGNLTSNGTKSCGCLRKEQLKIHNLIQSKIYRVWISMKDRCNNKNNKSYKNYGARGIRICDSWLNDFISFYNWSINNGYKEGLSINRIDVNGDYEPINCRWIDVKIQSNNRRNNHFITYNNETHTIAEWSEILNIKYTKLRDRIIRLNWSIEKAINTK